MLRAAYTQGPSSVPIDDPRTAEQRRRSTLMAGIALAVAAVAVSYVSAPIGAALALVFVVLAAADWRISTAVLLPAFVAVVMLAPADLRLTAQLPVDMSIDRMVLASLLLAWGVGIVAVKAPPLTETGRSAGRALLWLVAVGFTSMAVNALTAGTPIAAQGKSLFVLVSYAGVFFLTVSLVPGWQRARTIAAIAVGTGAIAAVTGAVERIGITNPIRWVFAKVPGLALDSAEIEVLSRGSGVRVSGTGEHPIAFGGALALLLPLALYFTFTARDRVRQLAWAGATALIGGTMLLTVSRSALLTAATGFLVLLVVWPKYRGRLLTLAVVGLFAAHMLMPGVLGTFRATLSPDYLARTEGAENPYNRGSDYPRVAKIIPERPLFGMGYNEFDPEKYFYLDNQALKLLIELGIAGLIFIALFVIRTARVARMSLHRGPPERSMLAGALLASVLSFVVLSVSFDTFSFVQVTYLFFLFAALAVRTATDARESAQLSAWYRQSTAEGASS